MRRISRRCAAVILASARTAFWRVHIWGKMIFMYASTTRTEARRRRAATAWYFCKISAGRGICAENDNLLENAGRRGDSLLSQWGCDPCENFDGTSDVLEWWDSGDRRAAGEVNQTMVFGKIPYVTTCLSMGNPHCVIWMNEISKEMVCRIGEHSETSEISRKRSIRRF